MQKWGLLLTGRPKFACTCPNRRSRLKSLMTKSKRLPQAATHTTVRNPPTAQRSIGCGLSHRDHLTKSGLWTPEAPVGGETMARADLLVSLVKAGTQGDRACIKRAAEALAAEENHRVLAQRLEESLRADSGPATQHPAFDADGRSAEPCHGRGRQQPSGIVGSRCVAARSTAPGTAPPADAGHDLRSGSSTSIATWNWTKEEETMISGLSPPATWASL